MNYPIYDNIQLSENQFNQDYYYHTQKNNSLYNIPENQQNINGYLNNNINEFYYYNRQIPENMNENNSINDKDIREFGNNILYNSNSGEKIIFKENDNDNDDEKYIEKL